MAKRKTCKSCDRVRPVFVFDKYDKCDFCRRNDVRKVSKRHVLDLDDVRLQRNMLLSQTDYMDNVSWRDRRTVSELKKFDTYRNKLRDITDECDTPDDVVWPSPPKSKRKKKVINKKNRGIKK